MAIPELFNAGACITDYAADVISSGDSRCAGAVKDSASAFACDTADSVARAGDSHIRSHSTICYGIFHFITFRLITAEQTTDVIFSTHDSIFDLYIIGRQAAVIIAVAQKHADVISALNEAVGDGQVFKAAYSQRSIQACLPALIDVKTADRVIFAIKVDAPTIWYRRPANDAV